MRSGAETLSFTFSESPSGLPGPRTRTPGQSKRARVDRPGTTRAPGLETADTSGEGISGTTGHPSFMPPSLAGHPTAAFPVAWDRQLSSGSWGAWGGPGWSLCLWARLCGDNTHPGQSPTSQLLPQGLPGPEGLPGGLHPACSACCPCARLTHSSVSGLRGPSEETGPAVRLQPSCPLCPVPTDSKARLNGRGLLGSPFWPPQNHFPQHPTHRTCLTLGSGHPPRAS